MAIDPGVERVGVVVGRLDQGEADRIVRLLTPEFGLCSVFARGARKAGSSASVLDVGVRARVRVRAGRSDLLTFAGAEVEDARIHVRRSLIGLATTQAVCEVIAALAGRGAPEPRLYGLVETALLLLDAADADPGSAFRAGVEAKALTFAGVAPVLDRCVACARPVSAEMAFLPSGGGVHHRDEVPADAPGVVTVSEGYLAAVEGARRRPLRESLDLSLPAGPDILGATLEAHIGHALPARRMLGALA